MAARVKLALAIVAVVLLAAGCSRPPKDPFVGTWNDPTGNRVVVTRKGSDYVAVAYRWGRKGQRVDFYREGNRLLGHADFRLPGEPMGMTLPPPVAEIEPSGRLYFSLFGRNAMLRRVSTSTATPASWP